MHTVFPFVGLPPYPLWPRAALLFSHTHGAGGQLDRLARGEVWGSRGGLLRTWGLSVWAS